MTNDTPTTDPTAKPREEDRRGFTPHDRVLLLDMWQRSGLTAHDFGALVGVTKATLFAWKTRFERSGPAGLSDQPRGAPPGSRLTEPTQRAILMLKQGHPEWGCERIRDVLMRGEGYSASAGAIAHLLRENGYELEEVETSPHAPAVQHFERARPNQLWQTDLFTFLLKRENRRVYLVVYLDDHSRFIVGYGVWASAGGALVREVLEAAIANFGAPEEVLTDNGPQYVTWRGTSAFAKLLERRGIRHIVARPRRPQTLGKTERFWGTLWRECVEAAVFGGLDDARRRVGHFIDHYNFQRPHQGIEGLVPADRFFAAAPQVKDTLLALYSPPCCPRYNGGIEASIGALTMRTHLAAAAAGHPEYWTCEDLAAATAAPAPSVPPITRAERRRFLAHYQTAITAGDHHAPMALQHRTAIVHTLQDLGYVSITRRADIVHPLTAQKRKRFRT